MLNKKRWQAVNKEDEILTTTVPITQNGQDTLVNMIIFRILVHMTIPNYLELRCVGMDSQIQIF